LITNALCFISALPKNFTALIPGTTVEILDQDSKNVIQLIIAAYNVSPEALRLGFPWRERERENKTFLKVVVLSLGLTWCSQAL